ncbi:MAG TPA: hypothetical protein VHZ76_08350 [Gammaproteobacteria bacterium]|jgi:hypothetical protein|nr:hypothetical protein [Gammaproteobacteria bacterium]
MADFAHKIDIAALNTGLADRLQKFADDNEAHFDFKNRSELALRKLCELPTTDHFFPEYAIATQLQIADLFKKGGKRIKVDKHFAATCEENALQIAYLSNKDELKAIALTEQEAAAREAEAAATKAAAQNQSASLPAALAAAPKQSLFEKIRKFGSWLFRTETFYDFALLVSSGFLFITRVEEYTKAQSMLKFLPAWFKWFALSYGIEFIFELSVLAKGTFYPETEEEKQLPWYRRFVNTLLKGNRIARLFISALWFSFNLISIISAPGIGFLIAPMVVVALNVTGLFLDVVTEIVTSIQNEYIGNNKALKMVENRLEKVNEITFLNELHNTANPIESLEKVALSALWVKACDFGDALVNLDSKIKARPKTKIIDQLPTLLEEKERLLRSNPSNPRLKIALDLIEEKLRLTVQRAELKEKATIWHAIGSNCNGIIGAGTVLLGCIITSFAPAASLVIIASAVVTLIGGSVMSGFGMKMWNIVRPILSNAWNAVCCCFHIAADTQPTLPANLQFNRFGQHQPLAVSVAAGNMNSGGNAMHGSSPMQQSVAAMSSSPSDTDTSRSSTAQITEVITASPARTIVPVSSTSPIPVPEQETIVVSQGSFSSSHQRGESGEKQTSSSDSLDKEYSISSAATSVPDLSLSGVGSLPSTPPKKPVSHRVGSMFAQSFSPGKTATDNDVANTSTSLNSLSIMPAASLFGILPSQPQNITSVGWKQQREQCSDIIYQESNQSGETDQSFVGSLEKRVESYYEPPPSRQSL